jgi:hypothetical protein
VPGDASIHLNLNTAHDWTASGLSCDTSL